MLTLPTPTVRPFGTTLGKLDSNNDGFIGLPDLRRFLEGWETPAGLAPGGEPELPDCRTGWEWNAWVKPVLFGSVLMGQMVMHGDGQWSSFLFHDQSQQMQEARILFEFVGDSDNGIQLH